MKVFCLYYTDKYTPAYVSNLYRGLKRFSKVDFEFICYSDNLGVEADKVVALPTDTKIKKHWHKIKFFDSTFADQQPGEEIIVLDIDQIVVNSVDNMLSWPIKPGDLCSYDKWWGLDPNNPMKINGGWYKFISGTMDYVYQKYIADPEYWQLYYFNQNIVTIPYFGEQNFVQDTVLEHGHNIITMPGRYVAKYHISDSIKNLSTNLTYIKKFNEPYMILDNVWNDAVKIVHFADLLNDIHHCTEPWINEFWQ